MKDGHAVNAFLGYGRGVGPVVGYPRARHGEAQHNALDFGDHVRGVKLDGGADKVAVEQEVEVFIGGDPLHDLVAGGVVESLGCVEVSDPGRQLLERHVDHGACRRPRLGRHSP